MTHDDGLLFIGELDQPVPTDNGWILDKIESIIVESVEKHDAYHALNACKQLVQVAKLSGIGLAKALYLIKSNWSAYGQEEEFEDIAYVYIGLHKATVDRYVQVWEMFDKGNVPPELEQRIKQRNIKELIPIAKAMKQGYEIDDDQWEDIAAAPDFQTIAQIVREDIKGKEPRKGALILVEDGVGTIWAFRDGERFFVGSMEVTSDDEAVQQAVERIRKGAGILKQ